MFGYVMANSATLTEEEQQRFRAAYCGLCRSLKQRCGQMARMTLSYDMTFLALLLGSLYEPTEQEGLMRCGMRPVKPRRTVTSEASEYAADMNILLSWYVLLDHERDDRSAAARTGLRALRAAFTRVEQRWPEKCRAVREIVEQSNRLEAENTRNPDQLANLTGRLLGEIYAWKDDVWADSLRMMGEAMGRFIWFMDAYDDMEDDLRRDRFNPLLAMARQEGFEVLIRQILSMQMAECAEEFEKLPLVRDVGLLRNVIYSGVWVRYAQVNRRRLKKKGEGRPTE